MYRKKIRNHPIAQIADDTIPLHIYNIPIYNFLSSGGLKGKFVLEIGCGRGNLLMALCSNRNENVYGLGVDFDNASISEANALRRKYGVDNCDFLCCDINELRVQDKFDYIIMSDVIEHLSDSEINNILNTCKSFLSKDGIIIMHTPNGRNIMSISDFSVTNVLYYFMQKKIFGIDFSKSVDQLYYEQVHINLKSYRQWKKLFSKTGWTLKVIYDESTEISRLERLFHLCGNMMLIAWR